MVLSVGAVISICVAAACLLFLFIGGLVFGIRHRRKALEDRNISDIITQVVGPGGRLPYNLPREALLREPPPRYTSHQDINNHLSIINPGFCDDDTSHSGSNQNGCFIVSQMLHAPPVYCSNPNMCNTSLCSVDCEPPPSYSSRQDLTERTLPANGADRVRGGRSGSSGLSQNRPELPILSNVLGQSVTMDTQHARYFDAAEYQNAKDTLLERLKTTGHESATSMALPLYNVKKVSMDADHEMKTVGKIWSSADSCGVRDVVNLSYKETSSTDSLDSINVKWPGCEKFALAEHNVGQQHIAKKDLTDQYYLQNRHLNDENVGGSCQPLSSLVCQDYDKQDTRDTASHEAIAERQNVSDLAADKLHFYNGASNDITCDDIGGVSHKFQPYSICNSPRPLTKCKAVSVSAPHLSAKQNQSPENIELSYC